MAKCPAPKRMPLIVKEERLPEFENAMLLFKRVSEKEDGNKPRLVIDYTCAADWIDDGTVRKRWDKSTLKPMLNHPLYDFLHGEFQGEGRWRIVIGIKPPKRKHPLRDWTQVWWVLVQFNNKSDLMKARLKWRG